MRIKNLFPLLVMAAAVIISCNSKDNKMLGDWYPYENGKINKDIKITFLDDSSIVSTKTYRNQVSVDTVSYEMKESGKLLVSREKSGRIDEMVIVELNDKMLVFHPKNDARDTMRFARD